ncbi:MAG: hypothetical protein AAGK25_02190 [Pseudomonadota bacterium]
MTNGQKPSRCEISQVGKSRNGKPRWWCTKHGAPATGRYGVRLDECEAAYLDYENFDQLTLDPDVYPGGIGIWGAVEPVFNTTGKIDKPGVHVHARSESSVAKEIDKTFDAVSMTARTDLFQEGPITITQETAVAYYVSRFLGHEIKHLFCVKCGTLHLDAGYFATHPHKKHLCHACGNFFHDSEKSISNPIMYFRALSPAFQTERKLVKSEKVFEAAQSDYPGGIQIWASNPALIWTAERAEEQGIHIHAFVDHDDPVVDDTFGKVVIDGLELDYLQVAQLMAQQTLPHLQSKVVSLSCPKCHRPHFDKGAAGVNPKKQHTCEFCDASFENPGKRKLVVSNPIIELFNTLGQQGKVD